MRPHVLLVAPQQRDLEAVERLGLEQRYRISPLGQDLDRDEGVEPELLLDRALQLAPDGAVGTKDRSALLAAIVSERLGLPGPAARAVLACQYKPGSRERQRRLVPEATPSFALLDGQPPFPFPFFAKPVVGRLSQGARRIESEADLRTLRRGGSRYETGFAALARLAGGDPGRLQGFLAEELLEGRELTLEGYAHGSRVTIVGVTDSVHYPGTRSFERFEYPSSLPPAHVRLLERIARRIVPDHGLEDGFFNIEFAVPEPGASSEGPAVSSGPAKIIELNARIASQFARLVELCHGRSTYEALFDLACGRDPGWSSREPHGVAVSYVLRVFENAFVEAVPEPEPDLELLVRPGQPLSQQGPNDVASFRLAIFVEWGETRELALEKCRDRAARLRDSFRLRPL
ncbi:MAG: ATP-grasp domain-containing protein [Gaiellaceae bacterium]